MIALFWLWSAACAVDPCRAFVRDSTACLDAYCADAGADSPECTCWVNGRDSAFVDTDGDGVAECTCVDLDLEDACLVYDLSDYQRGDLDCAEATAAADAVCP